MGRPVEKFTDEELANIKLHKKSRFYALFLIFGFGTLSLLLCLMDIGEYRDWRMWSAGFFITLQLILIYLMIKYFAKIMDNALQDASCLDHKKSGIAFFRRLKPLLFPFGILFFLIWLLITKIFTTAGLVFMNFLGFYAGVNQYLKWIDKIQE